MADSLKLQKYLHLQKHLFKGVVGPKGLQLKEIPMQMFSCEFSKIFQNSFFYRTPPVATSVLTSEPEKHSPVRIHRLYDTCFFLEQDSNDLLKEVK